jgi:hypothetical protein
MRKCTGVVWLLAWAFSAVAAPQREPEGFTPLFNGKDLSGWREIGSQGGYLVEEGKLICTPKGRFLYTEREFADFHLKFDFKLTPGANNGVAIRAPLEGDPAYVGMEIQILDDNHPRYKDRLRPAQYHGSIYDVVPAKRGFLKPAGEWNREEIIAEGTRVRVILNGVTIVDADLAKIEDPQVRERHPGLRRPKGHLGFCGHGDRVEFRNVRIKEL